MSLYLYKREYVGVVAGSTTPRDTRLWSYVDSTSEASILADFKRLTGDHDHPIQAVIKTDDGVGGYDDVKVYQYLVKSWPSAAPTVALIPETTTTDAADRAKLSEDYVSWNSPGPLWFDTSMSPGDGFHWPGHVARYLVVYNGGTAQIGRGKLCSYHSNADGERNHVELRGSGKVTEPPCGIALENIAVGDWGKMAVGEHCDVKTSDDRSDTGAILYAGGTGVEDEATDTVTSFEIGAACGGIGGLGTPAVYETGWARIHLR